MSEMNKNMVIPPEQLIAEIDDVIADEQSTIDDMALMLTEAKATIMSMVQSMARFGRFTDRLVPLTNHMIPCEICMSCESKDRCDACNEMDWGGFALDVAKAAQKMREEMGSNVEGRDPEADRGGDKNEK